MRRRDVKLFAVAGAAVLALAIGSTAALASTGAFHRTSPAGYVGPAGYTAQVAPRVSPTQVPPLPGTVVDVTLADMGGRMGGYGGGGYGGGYGGMGGGMTGRWNGSGTTTQGRGPMTIVTSRTSVPAGQVSLRVTDAGVLTHELVVLPLADGAQPGQRTVGADGRISEAGSVGEVSNNNGAGAGEGLQPGGVGWTTLDLKPGRYELVCNIAGHYAAGMYAELDVTA